MCQRMEGSARDLHAPCHGDEPADRPLVRPTPGPLVRPRRIHAREATARPPHAARARRVRHGVAPSTADAQFNPDGRKKGKKPGTFQPGGRPGTKPGGKPGEPSTSRTRPGHPTGPDPGTKPGAGPRRRPRVGSFRGKGPGKEALIQRYTEMPCSARPGAAFPLQRLAELYRERRATSRSLIADFEKRAEQADGWNALVGLAGLSKQDGQHARAIGTYKKAIAKKPGEATAIMALANLLSDRGDKAAALARACVRAADCSRTTPTRSRCCAR